MFNLLFVSSTSACFEMQNDLIFNTEKEYSVLVNGEKIDGVFDTNVFSVYNLTPNTQYLVSTTLEDFELSFVTKNESCCLNVRDFGAKGDGKTLDTGAIESAINLCLPFGRVYIPKGVYYVSPILLKSDITLEIDKDAILLASVNENDFPVLPGEIIDYCTKKEIQCSSWEGQPQFCYQSIISAYHCKNINVVGQGLIDGNAQNSEWWINVKDRKIGRPRLFFINDCENVTVHGITVANSPSWTIHPFFSKNFQLLDAKVNAPKISPNTDGCDPESCDTVKIIGTVFSVGDDCIAIKSGKIYMGAKYKTPAKFHTIRNCHMKYGHGAVVLGSEMSGGVENLSVNRCKFTQTDRGLRIKTCRGRGKTAVIDNVSFEKIRMENVLTPLVINMFYNCGVDGKREFVWSKEKLPIDDTTPYLGRFSFNDISCVDCEWAAGYFYGLPEQPIKQINISNVMFEFKENASSGYPAMMSNIDVCSKKGLYFNNVKEVNIDNVNLKNVNGELVQCENVEIKNINL